MQIYFIILFFSYIHEIVKIYNVFSVMYFAAYLNKSMSISAVIFSHYILIFNRHTLGIRLSVYERMFTNKCCQRDVETLLHGN